MRKGYKPDIAIPPGETIKDELQTREWDEGKLSRLSGLHPNVIKDVISGKREITPGIALALNTAFGVSAQFWLNLEKNYQDTKKRLRLRPGQPLTSPKKRL